MAVVPTITGKVKSIEQQGADQYYKVKLTLSDCFSGYFGSKQHKLEHEQSVFCTNPEQVKCKVGDEVWVCAFSQSQPNTWEIEGITMPQKLTA